MKKIFGISVLVLFGWSFVLFAQDVGDGDIQQAQKLLAMNKTDAKRYLETIDGETAQALLTQVLFIERKSNPNIDYTAYIISHLESLKAIELSQKRLNNLLIVLGFTLALFSAFCIYVIWDQRMRIKQLIDIVESLKQANSEVESGSKVKPTSKGKSGVYRGE